MLPFTIKYSRSFKKLSKADSQKILQYIERVVISKSAKNTFLSDTNLTYKGSTSWSRGNMIKMVDKGIFSISDNDSNSILTYEIFLYELFYFVTPFSILAGIISLSFWVPLMFLSWLGGMNWIIIFTKHRTMFDEINSFIKQTDDQSVGANTILIS